MFKDPTIFVFAALVSGAVQARPLSYTLTTVAGGAPAFEFAEGKLATSFLIQGFNQPAIDRQGNFDFSMANRVIRVTQDGLAATAAQLTTPSNLLFDPQGRPLIFDNFSPGSYRIRRVELNGTISTIAGTGQAPSAANDGEVGLATAARVHATLGAYDSSGNLYFLDTGGGLNVRRIDTSGHITTVAHGVGTYPAGMSSDGANIYLTDLTLP